MNSNYPYGARRAAIPFLILLEFLLLEWVVFSTAVPAASYDATGRWNYAVSDHWNNCGERPDPVESGTVILIQSADTFLLVVTSSTALKFKTVNGSINGAVYVFNDKYREDYGWTNDSVSFTLSSPSSGAGTGSWRWSDGEESCSGGYSVTVTRQPESPPVHNASGRWNFNESGYWNNCGEANPASDAGTMTIIQSNNRITATDSKGGSWKGFVSSTTYTLVDSYAEDNGITSDVLTVDLSSASQGSGQCWWVWDLDGNSNEHCEGGSTISIAKQGEKITKAMPWLPPLLLGE
jgi:hypothetical protein